MVMTRLNVKLVLATLTAFAVAGGSVSHAQLNNGVPKEVQDVGVEQRLGEKLPVNVLVTDSSGRKVRLWDLVKGNRPVIFTLNYSDCPMLCSVQLTELTRSLDKLDLNIGADFELITLSIDPKESLERARATKQKYVQQLGSQEGAASGWHFAIASQDSIRQVTESLGFRYTYDKATKEYYHAAMLAFISPDGVITRYSLDVAFPEDQLRLAIVEAGKGTVGGVVEQFMLLCFSYDENRNRYVASAWKIMRIGGLLTVGMLLATLTPFWFGRRRSDGSHGQSEENSDAGASQVAAGGDPAVTGDGRV